MLYSTLEMRYFMKNIIKKILTFLFPWLFETESESHIHQTTVTYHKRDYLTSCEFEFYQKLIQIEKRGDYKVIPQVNLASIIHKSSNVRYNTELFRNIDFGIFNSRFELLLLIELNDATHNQNERQKRDQKVKSICQSAHIPILFFYTKYPNEESYIIQRVLNTLENKEIYKKQEYPYSTPK